MPNNLLRTLCVSVISLALMTSQIGGVLLAGTAKHKARTKTGRQKTHQRTKKQARAPHHRRASHTRLPEVEPELESPENEEADMKAREDWFWFQRRYPFDTVPAELRQKAWEKLPLRSFNANQAQRTWRHVGPVSIDPLFPNTGVADAGRITTVAVSPANAQIIVVGTSTGGIWRSEDRGTTFRPVSDNHVDSSVGSVAFSRSNPAIVYAGMGEPTSSGYYPGTGVLKSTDAGATWTRVSNTTLPAPARTPQIQVDPTNPDRVYVSQFNAMRGNSLFRSGFFLSTDGGTSWRKTLSGAARHFVLHPTNPQTLYLGMNIVDGTDDSSPGVFKSTDGGTTWDRAYTLPITSTRSIELAVTPTEPEAVYALFGNTFGPELRLARSADGGTNWETRELLGQVDQGQFGYNSYLQVDPANPATLYVGTRDIFRSTDRGATWANLTLNFPNPPFTVYLPRGAKQHSDQHVLIFTPTQPNEIYVGHDGGLYRSTDACNTFTSVSRTLGTADIRGYALHPTNPELAYAGLQDNGTLRRQPGTNQWKGFRGGDGGQCVINPVDPTIVFTTFQNIGVTINGNNGLELGPSVANPATFGEPSSGARVNFYPPFVSNGVDQTIYFGTWRLWVSRNLGENWTAPGGTRDLTKGRTMRGADVLTAIGVSRSNPNVIYTGSAQGQVMSSTDGGQNWTIRTEGLPDRSITSLTVSAAEPGTVFVTLSGYATQHVFRSNDFGATWTSIDANLPDIPCNAFLVDPLDANTVYVGTDVGVFRSTNNGGQWEAFNQGMPPVVISFLVSQRTGLIHAATYGRGVYELPVPDNTPPTVQLTAPRGGETIQIDSTFSITWTSTDNVGVVRHDIALSTDGGETFATAVASGLPGNATTFSWRVPAPETQRARIRVTAADAANNQGSATSEAFTIAP